MAGTEVITAQSGTVPALPIDDLDQAALRYAQASKSAATLRAYASDFADFTAWIKGWGLAHPIDTTHVGRYLAYA